MSNARPISYYRVDLYFREDRPRRKLSVTRTYCARLGITLPLSVRLFSNIAQVTSQPGQRSSAPAGICRGQAPERSADGRPSGFVTQERYGMVGAQALARMATGTQRKTVVGKQPAQRTQRENPLPRARAIMLARSSNSLGHQPPALISMRTRANARSIATASNCSPHSKASGGSARSQSARLGRRERVICFTARVYGGCGGCGAAVS